jgi:hypothetical protein
MHCPRKPKDTEAGGGNQSAKLEAGGVKNTSVLSSLEKHAACVANWRAKNSGTPIKNISEFRLYSDEHFIDHLVDEEWPYLFLNAIPVWKHGEVCVALYLRLKLYVTLVDYDMSKTDNSTYHGGSIVDEIAALCSLSLGVRLESGGMSRQFQFEQLEDPLGRPLEFDFQRPRMISLVDGRTPVLPDVSKNRLGKPNQFNLDNLRRLSSIQHLTASTSVALVRVARLYQEALWISESAPEIAWLLLVSAVEVAAEQWNSSNQTPTERLRASQPKIARLIAGSGGEELLAEIANILSPSLGSTKKFRDFVLNFSDDALRNGTLAEFKTKLDKIYGYRSKALHGGIPFPAPMCQPPHFVSEERQYFDKPVGLAAGSKGSVWLAKDLPLNLHGFHRVVRASLLNWWDSFAKVET